MAVSDLQSDSDLDSIRYSCDSGPLKLTFSAKIDIESPKCTPPGGGRGGVTSLGISPKIYLFFYSVPIAGILLG